MNRPRHARTYMPKKPCKFGHMAPRYEANGHCTECATIKMRERYQADREQWNEKAKANNRRRRKLHINEVELIKRVVSALPTYATKSEIAELFAEEIAKTKVHFCKERFIKHCLEE